MPPQCYKKDPGLLPAVFDLLDTVFPGIDGCVRAAGPLGLNWSECSTPFVRFDGDTVVAHVGVLSLPLVMANQQHTVAGIHAVCTHPHYRSQGRYRALMAEAMRWVNERFDTAILFTDIPAIYEPFGFRSIMESRFVTCEVPPSDSACHAALHRLSWSKPADVALLRRIVAERSPVSTTLGVGPEEAVFAFNAVDLPMWSAAELDAILSFAVDQSTLRFYDVVAKNLPGWPDLAKFLPTNMDRVEFLFCPDGLGADCRSEQHTDARDGVLMVKGEFLPESVHKRLPQTAEC